MPKHVLENLAWTNVVGVQEDVKSTRCEEVVELQSGGPGLDPSVAQEDLTLAAQQAQAFQESCGNLL